MEGLFSGEFFALPVWGIIFGGTYFRNFTVSRRKMTCNEIVLEKPMVIKLFFVRVLVYKKSLFIISTKCCNACRRVKRFQIAYANLLVFSKHYFEVRVLCFVLNGTLEDLLYKLFSLIDVIYFAFIIGGLANIIILTTIPD